MERRILDTVAASPMSINKWDNYSHIYAELFEGVRASRGQDVTSVVEIGVQCGGSTWMLARMFPHATIYGVDIDDACKDIVFPEPEADRIRIVIGDISNAETWAHLPAGIDLVMDDGSHIPREQRAAMHMAWPRLYPGGVMYIEDLEHSTYHADDPFFADIDAVSRGMHSHFEGCDAAEVLRGCHKITQWSGAVAFHKSRVPTARRKNMKYGAFT